MGGKNTFIIASGIFLSGLILFLPFIGQVNLFDWDEINFAESAREMLVTGDYSTVRINYTPFAEKPPLFIWMQAFSMRIFGVNEFAARFPNALCGILTMLILFFTGRKLLNNDFGAYWSFCYVAGVLPLLYFKSGIIDPWYNLFTFLALLNFYFHYLYQDTRFKYLIFSAIFLGLAILTKGPVALLIYTFVVFLFIIFSRNKFRISPGQFSAFAVFLVITGGSWFIFQLIKGNYQLVGAFINYHIKLFSTADAGHGGNFFYHFYILFFLVFPTSVIALPFFFQKIKYVNPGFTLFKKLMLITLILVLVIFTIVKTKIVHYSSMAYFPLSFFAAIAVNEDILNRHKIRKWQLITIFIIGFLYAAIFLAFLMLPSLKNFIVQHKWIEDSFFYAGLNANVNFNFLELLSVLILPVVLILTIIWFRLGKRRNAWRIFIAGSILFNYIVIIHAAPKVELYCQNALIEFCKKNQSAKSVVNTRGFFSYAPLLYTKAGDNNTSWPLSGKDEEKTDKQIFIVIKINKAFDILRKEPDLKLLYHKNGYVFTEKIKEVP